MLQTKSKKIRKKEKNRNVRADHPPDLDAGTTQSPGVLSVVLPAYSGHAPRAAVHVLGRAAHPVARRHTGRVAREVRDVRPLAPARRLRQALDPVHARRHSDRRGRVHGQEARLVVRRARRRASDRVRVTATREAIRVDPEHGHMQGSGSVHQQRVASSREPARACSR